MKKNGAISQISQELTKREKIFLFNTIIIQFLLGVLDFLAISLVTIAGLSYLHANNSSNVFLRLKDNVPFFRNLSPNVLLILGFLILLIKSLCSIFFLDKLFTRMAQLTANFATKLYSRTHALNPVYQMSIGEKDLPNAVVDGSKALILGYLTYGTILISEIIILLVIYIPLIIVSPVLTGTITITFALGLLVLSSYIKNRASFYGHSKVQSENSSRTSITTYASLSKFSFFSDHIDAFVSDVHEREVGVGEANARLHYLQQLPKYGLEVLIILSLGISLITSKFIAGSIDIFKILLLSSIAFRLLPGLLRILGAALFLQSNTKEVEVYFQHQQDFFTHASERPMILPVSTPGNPRGEQGIHLANLTFGYQSDGPPLIKNFDIWIPLNTFVLISGPSGKGKSTLLDIIAGFKSPTHGSINFYAENELKFAYMPQQTVLVPGDIYSNIALGQSGDEFDRKRIDQIVDLLNLGELRNRKLGWNSDSFGLSSLPSGGELQRIGFARCLYLNPDVLFLDEPTSSVDAETEALIINYCKSYSKNHTVIAISHSLTFREHVDLEIQI